jgi:DNA-binding CsgD family transcriptional regulator/tetratricopeptide (TPR) repeat protein
MQEDDDVHRLARAKVLVGAGVMAVVRYHFDRAVIFDEALALGRATGDRSTVIWGTVMLGFSAEARGETERAAEHFAAALALSREADDAWITGWQLGNLGRIAMVRGDHETATRLIEESLIHHERTGDRHGAAWSYQYLGRIAERRGDHVRATAHFEEALAAAQDVGDKMGMAWSLGYLGRAARLQGDFAQATEWLEASLRFSRDIGDRWGVAIALGNLGRVALDRHEYQRAAALFEESLVLSQGLTGRGRRVSYALHYLGVVAAELGQPERAGRLLGAAAALQEAGGRNVSPLDRAERGHHVDDVRRALGDAGFTEAWEAGRAMSLERAVEYALTAPPMSSTPTVKPEESAAGPAGSAAGPAASPLSARELEVALLIALGHTNRQVADALVISERTASTHVTHILNKLGFSTRSQVAAWAAERGLTAR